MRLRPFDARRDDAFARALHAETVAADLAPLPEPVRSGADELHVRFVLDPHVPSWGGRER